MATPVLIKSVRIRGDLTPKVQGGLDGVLDIYKEGKDIVLFARSVSGGLLPNFLRIRFPKRDISELNDIINSYLKNSDPTYKVIQDPYDPNNIPYQYANPSPEPKPTPQQVTEQTQQETTKKEEQQTVTDVTKTDSKTTLSNTPPNLQPQGGDKLAIVLNKKRSEIKRILIPIAISIATELGIKYASKISLPDVCLPQSEINKLVIKRNALVNRLNNIVKITDALAKTLTGIGLLLTILVPLIKKIKDARKASSLAAKFIPSPPGIPGIVISTLNDLKDSQETTTEKLNKAIGVLASANLAISTLNAVLLKLIAILASIDVVLKKCNTDQNLELTSLSPTLLTLEQVNNEVQQNANQEIYNGFILEIVEVPYSPTVTRRKAVAKNSQGIILISTPLSFTTESSILINELKLLIDSNNLKAD